MLFTVQDVLGPIPDLISYTTAPRIALAGGQTDSSSLGMALSDVDKHNEGSELVLAGGLGDSGGMCLFK